MAGQGRHDSVGRGESDRASLSREGWGGVGNVRRGGRDDAIAVILSRSTLRLPASEELRDAGEHSPPGVGLPGGLVCRIVRTGIPAPRAPRAVGSCRGAYFCIGS